MVRVVCEYCQTVYNIPDLKLTKQVSQATCKVCQNKIVIRREATVDERETGGMSAVMVNNKGDLVREPMTTPTSTSAAPPPAEDSAIGETELSNSWREAIVDNRETIQMLKKVGVPGPRDASTAAGPKVVIGGVVTTRNPESDMPTNAQIAMPPDDPMPEETDRGDAMGGAPRVGVKTTSSAEAPPKEKATPQVMRTTPPAFVADDRGASAAVASIAGLAALITAAGLVWSHGWAAGFSGLLAFAAASFAASAALLTATLRRRTALGVVATLFVAAFVALVATAALLALHRTETHALLESKAVLAPLAKFF